MLDVLSNYVGAQCDKGEVCVKRRWGPERKPRPTTPEICSCLLETATFPAVHNSPFIRKDFADLRLDSTNRLSHEIDTILSNHSCFTS